MTRPTRDQAGPPHVAPPFRTRKAPGQPLTRGIVAVLMTCVLLFLVRGLALGGPADQAGKLEQQRKRLEQAAREEGSILDALEAIEKSVAEKEAALDQLRARQAAMETRIAGLEKERQDLEVGLASRRIQLQKRLRALYKYSTKGFLQAIFAGGSGTDILKRTKYLQLIVRRDMELIASQRRSIARFGEVKRSLETERLQVNALTKDVEAQVTAAQEERQRKTALLRRIQQEKSTAGLALKELEAAAGALNRRVETLPITPSSITAAPAQPEAAQTTVANAPPPVDTRLGGNFAGQRGRLPFPVDGARVTKAFGRYKAPGMMAYDFHRGIDVTAPAGKPIKAIYSGEVKLAEWFKGYGLLTIIDHGDGYHSIYAHASKLFKKAGDRVKTGEKIGLVGDTGSFQGSYLYLEVREKGKAVNPLEWIRVPPDAMALEE